MEPLPIWRVVAPFALIAGLALAAALSRRPLFRVLLMSVGTLALYGVAQDMLTARLCPEYFTVAHNPIEGVTDPNLLALYWGVMGSVGGGLILGMVLTDAATRGSAPPASPGTLRKALALVLAGTATGAALGGLCTAYAVALAEASVGPAWAADIAPERHRAFMAVAGTHLGAYASAVLSSVVAAVWVVNRRRRAAR